MTRQQEYTQDVLQQLFDWACNRPYTLTVRANPDDLDELFEATIQFDSEPPCTGDPWGSFEQAVEAAFNARKYMLSGIA